MTALQEFSEDLSLLAETGLIAIKQGDEESAKKLFNAVGVIDPQSITKKMGYGLIALHKMEVKKAQDSFQDILNGDPSNQRAKAFLAFTHILSVLEEGDDATKMKSLKLSAQMAEEALTQADDESTKQLAQSILDWEKSLQDVENG